MNLDFNAIARILTLRYDPLRKPVQRRLTPADFAPLYTEGVEANVESSSERELRHAQNVYGLKKVAMSLSGGIDSRLTLAMMRKFLPEIKVSCVCVGFGDSDDEIASAREVARVQDCEFSEVIVNDVLRDLPRLISTVREPRWNLYQYYAFERGRKISKVFFTGDGGDETFGGYTFRYHKFLSMLPKASRWQTRAKVYLSCHERDWVSDQPKLFGSKIKFRWTDIIKLLRPSFDNKLPPLDQVFLADFNGKLLFDWLPVNAAFSRSLDMKIKSIFLSEQMIKLGTHVPWQQKYDSITNTGKLPLIKLLAEYENRPIAISKKGFSLNLASMWRSYGREKVSSYLNNDSEVVKSEIISRTWLDRTMLRMQAEGRELDLRYVNKLLSVLALEIWYRIFISKTMHITDKI